VKALAELELFRRAKKGGTAPSFQHADSSLRLHTFARRGSRQVTSTAAEQLAVMWRATTGVVPYSVRISLTDEVGVRFGRLSQKATPRGVLVDRAPWSSTR
jgi:hypothetical protein